MIEAVSIEHVPDARVAAWLDALDERHLASFTVSEVARALRALSSCYVERRGRLAEGGALATAGKRAAFALFYSPLHFLTVRQIARSLPLSGDRLTVVQDLGCGTGAAGAALAYEHPDARVAGTDRHPWAVAEANWTYRQLAIPGHAARQDLSRVRLTAAPGTAIVAAYVLNELDERGRTEMLDRLISAAGRGSRVVIVEPIARRLVPWWSSWEDAFRSAGGRSDEWRFAPSLPPRQRDLARAAGLSVRELTARTLFV